MLTRITARTTRLAGALCLAAGLALAAPALPGATARAATQPSCGWISAGTHQALTMYVSAEYCGVNAPDYHARAEVLAPGGSVFRTWTQTGIADALVPNGTTLKLPAGGTYTFVVEDWYTVDGTAVHGYISHAVPVGGSAPAPTPKPTPKPTAAPTPRPTAAPTPRPTPRPTPKPTAAPAPTPAPAASSASSTPSLEPSPSVEPVAAATAAPSLEAVVAPSPAPSTPPAGPADAASPAAVPPAPAAAVSSDGTPALALVLAGLGAAGGALLLARRRRRPEAGRRKT